jgi:hypothetical protein
MMRLPRGISWTAAITALLFFQIVSSDSSGKGNAADIGTNDAAPSWQEDVTLVIHRNGEPDP